MPAIPPLNSDSCFNKIRQPLIDILNKRCYWGPHLVTNMDFHTHQKKMQATLEKIEQKTIELIEPATEQKDPRIDSANDILEGLMEDLEKGIDKLDSDDKKINLKVLIKQAAALRKECPSSDNEEAVLHYITTSNTLNNDLRAQYATLRIPTPKINAEVD